MEKKNDKKIVIFLSIVIVLLSGVIVLLGYNIFMDKDGDTETKTNTIEKQHVAAEYKMSGNALEKFDLAFLKIENNGKNKVYSPLSIKYALEMLSEGASGNTKKQLDDVIGSYVSNKYENSKNMSLANSVFINNKYKEEVKTTYVDTLKDKYNAEVVFDTFKNVDNVNKWVSDKTFGVIKGLYPSDYDISDYRYILNNALSIDMEWKNRIQKKLGDEGTVGYMAYSVSFPHENQGAGVGPFDGDGYSQLEFNITDDENYVYCDDIEEYEEAKEKGCYDDKIYYNSVRIEAIANKYDIVNVLGEENIRKTVGDKANEWMDEHNGSLMVSGIKQGADGRDDVNDYLDKYIAEIDQSYKHVSGSTDFKFYDDEDIKVFAKELKEYNGVTLEYVGIMPKKGKLKDYIEKVDEKELNTIISNLKDISLDSFEEGYITKITGLIPMFKADYELKLMDDLKIMGITDVFDSNKADLSGIIDKESTYIDVAMHKANIEFSNDGIKAAAATTMGGAGNLDYHFDYIYEVPTKIIDLTFNKPFLYLIRNKTTGEVWFIGTVYEPIKFEYQD